MQVRLAIIAIRSGGVYAARRKISERSLIRGLPARLTLKICHRHIFRALQAPAEEFFIPLKFSGREPYRSKPGIGFATRSSQEARMKWLGWRKPYERTRVQ